MKTQTIKRLGILISMTLLVASCSKEVPQKTYPTQVTLDNWEQFVDAPQSVIDELLLKEAPVVKELPSLKNHRLGPSLGPACPNGPIFGQVTAWNGSGWSGIQNVQVTQANWSANTNLGGNYGLCSSASGAVCMNYNTSQTNGVSGLDIIIIRRHILGIAPFNLTTDNGLRQMVASDVDHNGVINDNDITAIQNAILQVSSLPGNNVTFVPIIDLVQGVVGDPWGLAFLQNNCRNNASYHMNRRAIKMGDASGNFTF